MQVILKRNKNADVIMIDVAHFNLNGVVNKQNLRYWAPENPGKVHQNLHTHSLLPFGAQLLL